MRARQILGLAVAVLTAGVLVVPAPALAATPQLAGVVRNAAGDGVGGICVDVHRADMLAEKATWTTGADGRWRASPTTEAPEVFGTGRVSVKVAFRDCRPNPTLAGQWFAGVRSADDAQVLLVDPGARETVRANATLGRGARITGVVVDGRGRAVPGACVAATHPDDPTVGGDAVADGSGQFAVAGLPAATYVLRGSDCTDPRTQATAHLGPGGSVARGVDDAARLSLAAGESLSIGRLQLPDDGVVTGTIRRGAQGQAGACVAAIDTASDTSHGTVTGADGSYKIAGLLPGRWLLRVTDCRSVAPRDQFATAWLTPSGTTADPRTAAAQPITVGGTVTLGVRSVRAGGAVAGRVLADGATSGLRADEGRQAVPGACVSAAPRGSLALVGSTVADGDGRWVIGGLDPDTSYQVAAYDCDASGPHGLDWAGAPVAGQGTPVAPAAGEVRGGVDVVLGDAVRRVAGRDRVETALQLARDAFASTSTVVLARADAYPDALAGAPLATLLGAPILLTDRGVLSPGVASAISDLGASQVVLLGLTAALSQTVEDQVRGIRGVDEVLRVGGETRFHTAAEIARFVGGTQAYVVEGASPDPARGWPDAVSVAGLAARTEAPLLLVTRDSLPGPTRDVINQVGFGSLTVVGGPAAVSDAVFGQLTALTDDLDRLAGDTRYGTSAAVVERATERGLWTRTTWLATGMNYPDALVAGAVVGQDGGLLQLVAGSDAVAGSPEALAVLDDLADGIHRTVLLGGPAAISETAEAQVRGVLEAG